MDSDLDKKIYQFYLPNQTGKGSDLSYYSNNWRRQKGSGLGGILGSIARRVIPLAKHYILPHAKKAIKNISKDILEGKNVKDTLKRHATTAIKDVGQGILNQSGSGTRAKLKKKSRKRSKLEIQNGTIKKRKAAKKRNRHIF